MKKLKLVNHNGKKDCMNEIEISLLQQSSASIKPYKSATECISCNNKTYMNGECYHCGFDANEIDIY